MEKETIENNQLLNDEGWIESLITGNTFTSNSKGKLIELIKLESE